MHASDVAVENDFYPPFTRGEMDRRRKLVADSMAQQGLDALLIYGNSGMVFGVSPGQANLMWLANYATCVDGFLVLTPDGELTMLLRVAHHMDNARRLVFFDDVRAAPVLDEGAVARLRELGVERGRIGIVGPYAGRGPHYTTIPVEYSRTLTAAFPNARLDDVTMWYESLRYVRSEEELALLRRAGVLGDAIFSEIIELTKPGITCRDLRRHALKRCAEEGATFAFSHLSCHDMSDPDSAYPDYYPVARRVDKGQVLLTELCVGYGDYWNKIWGSWFCGEPTADYRALRETAKAVHDSVNVSLKPGTSAADYNRLTDPITKAGYELEMPLISGWCALNHPPQAGIVERTRTDTATKQWRSWIFRSGETFTVCAWIKLPGTKKGLWVGTHGAISESGFETMNTSASSALHVC